jgi:response regulator RpfG family c-di-GMP phosphodiesterase
MLGLFMLRPNGPLLASGTCRGTDMGCQSRSCVIRLLVVDDHLPFVFALERVIKPIAKMMRAESYGLAREAMAQGTRFHAVLANLHLPDGGGIELLGEVKERQPDALRLLMSGSHAGAALALLHSDLIDTYLDKPFYLDDLRRALLRARRARAS